MAVRNFWVDGYIDGRASDLTGDPRSKDGGMQIDIRQRNAGCIDIVCKIRCEAYDDELITYITDNEGNEIYKYKTKR